MEALLSHLYPLNITIISDTHGLMHDGAWQHIDWADEVWHAGDLGPPQLLTELQARKPLRAVSGNADPKGTLRLLPETQRFEQAGMRVMIHHIVGRPGRYEVKAKRIVEEFNPQILVCGHSHILLVAPVPGRPGLIHINPGAAGHHGFHQMCTLIRMQAENGKVTNMEAVELGKRGRSSPAVI